MDIADLIAMVVVGLSIFAPALVKMSKSKSGLSGPAAPGEPPTGVNVPKKSTVATTRQRTITRTPAKKTAKKPLQRKRRGRKRPQVDARPEPAAAVHPAPIESPADSTSIEPVRKRTGWTPLQQAVVLREMLGRPKGLGNED